MFDFSFTNENVICVILSGMSSKTMSDRTLRG